MAFTHPFTGETKRTVVPTAPSCTTGYSFASEPPLPSSLTMSAGEEIAGFTNQNHGPGQSPSGSHQILQPLPTTSKASEISSGIVFQPVNVESYWFGNVDPIETDMWEGVVVTT